MLTSRHNQSLLVRFIHSPVTLSVCVLLTLYASTILYAQWKKERVWSARVEARAADLQIAQEKYVAIEERAKYAESALGREEYLRSSFDVAREGEALLILPPDRLSLL